MNTIVPKFSTLSGISTLLILTQPVNAPFQMDLRFPLGIISSVAPMQPSNADEHIDSKLLFISIFSRTTHPLNQQIPICLRPLHSFNSFNTSKSSNALSLIVVTISLITNLVVVCWCIITDDDSAKKLVLAILFKQQIDIYFR
jgi:hypothetical protein